MIRTQIYLPKELHEDLSQLARHLNVTMAELVREGVKKVVKSKKGKRKIVSRKEFLKILEETRGAWADSWDEKEEKKRENLELAEVKKLKRSSW